MDTVSSDTSIKSLVKGIQARNSFPRDTRSNKLHHIAIIAPSEREHNYLNRKGFYSKNVQIICDYESKVLNINARYADATHLAFIWKNTSVQRELVRCYEAGYKNSWLVGDSGYPQQPWLMTLIINAEAGSPVYNYTQLQMRARNCIERCIGVLKGRFRCLLGERTLRYCPEKEVWKLTFFVPSGKQLNTGLRNGDPLQPNESMLAGGTLINRYFR